MPTGQDAGSNQFRCEFCGRHFDTKEDLTAHQRDCAAANQSGSDSKVMTAVREDGPEEDRDWVSTP